MPSFEVGILIFLLCNALVTANTFPKTGVDDKVYEMETEYGRCIAGIVKPLDEVVYCVNSHGKQGIYMINSTNEMECLLCCRGWFHEYRYWHKMGCTSCSSSGITEEPNIDSGCQPVRKAPQNVAEGGGSQPPAILNPPGDEPDDIKTPATQDNMTAPVTTAQPIIENLTPPNAIENLICENLYSKFPVRKSSVLVTWNGSENAEHYEVILTSKGSSQFYEVGTPALDVKDLEPDTKYKIVVIAANKAGKSTSTSIDHHTWKLAPRYPLTKVHFTVTGSIIHGSWNIPEGRAEEEPLLGYKVLLKDLDSKKKLSFLFEESECTIQVEENRTFYATVLPYNRAGNGLPYASSYVQTYANSGSATSKLFSLGAPIYCYILAMIVKFLLCN
uniref:uncharacterized protein LOC120344989 n=1 Tax=Styela clava TaxID=7725 RepID=UPI00193AD3D6|nr:uncharacterized protein LOC120344989 [Styela clava]